MDPGWSKSDVVFSIRCGSMKIVHLTWGLGVGGAETMLADGIAWPQELDMVQLVLERLELPGLAA